MCVIIILAFVKIYLQVMETPAHREPSPVLSDEYFDCYICPNNKILNYSTTNREGYREYKSYPQDCEKCPYISQCTESQNHVKVVTQHIWENYLEICEDIRHTKGNKELYSKRKETIERLFGTAKEHHGFRYTQMVGKAKMEMKVGLTFACLNLKKLAKILDKRQGYTHHFQVFGAISQICLISLFKKLKAGFLNERKPALSTA